MALVVREALLLAGIGLGIGAAASVFASRLLTDMLYGVQANNVWILLAVAAALLAVAWAACQVPARRAMGIDPSEALRHE